MTKIINLFGGPGTGKSTTATGVFSCLKRYGISAEYVSEYAKDIAWEGTVTLLNNQLHIFAEQFRRQWRLLNKVDYVITDSPILLSIIYFRHYQSRLNVFTEDYAELTEKYFFETYKQFDNLNIYITRNKKYDERGRFQTLDEAKQIDNEVLQYLDSHNIPYMVTDSQAAIEDIINRYFIAQEKVNVPWQGSCSPGN